MKGLGRCGKLFPLKKKRKYKGLRALILEDGLTEHIDDPCRSLYMLHKRGDTGIQEQSQRGQISRVPWECCK